MMVWLFNTKRSVSTVADPPGVSSGLNAWIEGRCGEGGGRPRTARLHTMTLFWIIIPLAVLAVGIAVLPVLVGSFRHDRSVKEGAPATTQAAVREVNQWHS